MNRLTEMKEILAFLIGDILTPKPQQIQSLDLSSLFCGCSM